MKHFTKATFEQDVLQAEQAVLVDFWATWCGPCQMMAPVLEELGREKTDLVIGKVNVDEEMDLAMAYQVSSIPTLILFKNGKIAGKVVGYMEKEALCQALEL